MQVRDSMPSPPEWKLRFVQDTDSLLLLDVLGAVFAAGESDGRQLQGLVIRTVTLTQYEVASVRTEGLLWKDKAWVTEVGGGRGGCPSQGRPHLWAVHHTPHQVQ